MSFFHILLVLLLLGFAVSKPDWPHADDEPDWNQPDASWLHDDEDSLRRDAVKSQADQQCELNRDVTIKMNGGCVFHMHIQPDADDIRPCEYGIQRRLPPNNPHLTDLSLLHIEIPLERNRQGPVILDSTSGRIVLTPWCNGTCTTTISWTVTA